MIISLVVECRATITAQYEDGDVPVVKCLRSVDNHVLRSTGARHIVCPSADLIVDCKEEIVRKIKENPERVQHQERGHRVRCNL